MRFLNDETAFYFYYLPSAFCYLLSVFSLLRKQKTQAHSAEHFLFERPKEPELPENKPNADKQNLVNRKNQDDVQRIVNPAGNFTFYKTKPCQNWLGQIRRRRARNRENHDNYGKLEIGRNAPTRFETGHANELSCKYSNLSVGNVASQSLAVFILEINEVIVQQVIDLIAIIGGRVIIDTHTVNVMVALRVAGADIPFGNPLPVFTFEIRLRIEISRIRTARKPRREAGIDDDDFVL